MRLIATICCASFLLCGCAGDDASRGGSPSYVHSDWLYYHYHWYDDDFWIWADDHPDCCNDQDGIREALRTWYDGLPPEEQQKVRDRVEDWMEEQGIEPATRQSAADLIAQTASERWAAMTPEERRQWLDQRRSRIEQRRALESRLTPEERAELSQRAANLSPEQRAALLESGQGTSFERASHRGPPRSVSDHPTPGRAGLSGGTRFKAARGGGRGGRRR